MKNIAVIPIDNRPVCYQLIQQIAELTDECQIVLPDITLLGDLTKNADVSALIDWLDGINNIDIIVISLDTIAYGGLIPSRRSNDSTETVKSRILKLKEIILKKQAKVYAFSSIMRISNNNINEEEKEYWNLYGEKIFKYSYNLHKAEMTGVNEDNVEIPNDILNDYLLTRKRNFEINKLYIELKKQGLFDTLVFSKDDCAQYGLNVKEAEELKILSEDTDGIFIKTGADEIPLTLFSRAINKGKNIKISPVYLNSKSIDNISKYEDISVKESVESQIDMSGGSLGTVDDSDILLFINNFNCEQGELVMNVSVPLFDGNFIVPDKPYFIADILNANGADNNFVKALFSNKNLKEFYGYSAWNTTGNTLGSAIAAALTYFGAKNPNSLAFRKLQLTRFLDDWAYQANVRGEIRENSNNLSSHILKSKMERYEKILTEKFGKADFKYKFPWNRFFEIEIY